MGDSIKTLSVIIPAYNEGKTIHRILERVIAVDLHGIKKEIIIVNDCSKDNTLEAVQNFISSHNYTNLRLVSHEVNKGKGAAIRTGIQSATGNWVIVQDADLEYDPQEFNILLAPILNGFADVVYGSRFNLNLTDMETCYKMFRADYIKQINLKENRFGFEPEVTAKISRIENVRIYEVGISYYGRTYAEGKKIGWKDGVRTLWCIMKYNIWAKK